MSLTNSIDRRLTGFAEASSSGIPSPLFFAPLNGTLKPQIGIGTYTFARASTATMRDFNGIVHVCLTNEARFSNARRVENLLRVGNAKSNNINDGVWLPWIGTETINGTNQYTETVANSNVGIYAPCYTGDANGRTFVISFSAYKVSGTSNNYRARLVKQDFSVLTDGDLLTLTGSLRRYSVKITVSATTTSMYLHFKASVAEAGRVIHIENIQIEDVTAQTNQNPSEYVSYGMGDDHGCGVDGVKWFSTTNGNTVATFVMTEGSGTEIGSTGYLAEQEKINLAWPSENLTHANFTKNFLTPTLTTAVADKIGRLPQINTLKATDTSAHIHSVSMSVETLIDDEDVAIAFFAKAGTLSHAFVRISKGADTADQFFNVSAGTIGTSQDSGGDITIHTDRVAIHPVNNGYWCHLIVNGANAGLHTIYFGVASGDGSTSFSAANITDILLSMSGLQIQLDHEIGEYIPTSTVAVTKSADILSYDIANIPGEEFSAYIECDTETPCVSNCALISVENYGSTNPGYFLSGFSGKFEASMFDNSDTRVYHALSDTVSPGNHKGAASFSHTIGGRAAALNGVAMTTTIDLIDATTWSPNAFNVGFNNTNTGQPDFPIGNVCIYPKLTDAKLISITQ